MQTNKQLLPNKDQVISPTNLSQAHSPKWNFQEPLQVDRAKQSAYTTNNNRDGVLTQHGSAEEIRLGDLTLDEPLPLTIRIDLGVGKSANITALKHSDPRELALKFCEDHSLPEAIIEPLCIRITTNMAQHFKYLASTS